MADWAGLPADLLIEFAVRLTVTDWLKFSAVCTAWNQAAETALSSGRRPRPEPPWLMLAGSADPATAGFFSFQDGCCRTATLPEPAIQRRIWIGSAHGWVVTADLECALHLLNPVTGAQLPLPCITTMGYCQVLPRTDDQAGIRFVFRDRSFLAVHWPDNRMQAQESVETPGDQMPQRFFRKAVPLRDPASSGGYLIMMIHGPMRHLAFCRQSDAAWVILPSPYLFEDVIAYKGQIYAVTRCGVVLVWEPDGVTFKSRVVVPEHNEGDEYVYFRKYLAESLDGDLVLVWRVHRSCCYDDDESDSSSSDDESDSSSSDDSDDGDYYCQREYQERPDPTVRFQVFILREGSQGIEWKETDNLGGAALFIGYNSAMFFSADGSPDSLPDCIYFTDDLLGNSWRRKEAARDMGVFDMKSKVVNAMPSLVRHSKSWPPPVWITPSINS
ncbi:unnamed protein product [Urochloa humidicola]